MGARFLIEQVLPVWVTEPKNWTGAPSTGAYISLKGYQSVLFVIQTGAWAAGTAAVTINEALNVGAGTPQALTFTEYWTNSAAAGSAVLVRTTAAANTFDIINQADTMYVIEVTSDMLTLNSGYTAVSLAIASPGANADFYGAIAICSRTRYQTDTGRMINPLAN